MQTVPDHALNPGVGIGLRQPHYRELLQERAPAAADAPAFLEVHSENFFVEGGAVLGVLERARAQYPISLHGVGLSLGSADANANASAAQHLQKLKRLVERLEPALVSEHLCWSAIDDVYLNDLLPLPYNEAALSLMCARVSHVQETLKRTILIENISACLAHQASTMTETRFLAELARRTGCGILLDVNNLYVNAINFGFDPLPLIAELPADAIGEIHLAGHLQIDECLIDDHGSRVIPAVWELYRRTLQRIGPKPTLIEWDTNVPELAVLLDEAAIARGHLHAMEPVHA
jgi:uncharacterized protein (UPF0276 family)